MKCFLVAMKLLGAFLCFLTFSEQLVAQAPPRLESLGDRELQRQDELDRERRQEMEDQRPDIHFQALPAEGPAEYPLSESPCFIINEIRLTGDSAEKFRPFLKAAGDARGRCLGAEGVNILMARVQNAIVEAGFVTTRVVAEPQDLSAGLLTLTVIPGRVGAVRLSDDSKKHVLLAPALPLSRGDILNIRDVEQGLENLKRAPTAEADIELLPGAEEGESDLVVAWSQKPPFRFSASVDDSGLEATGRYQGAATVSIDNVFGFSDLFYFNYNHSLDGAETKTPYGTDGYSFYYSIPWGYWALTASTSYYNYYQEVAGYQTTYQYSGKSRNTNVELTRLVHRDALSKTSLGLAAFAASSRNYMDGAELEIQRRRTAGWEAFLSHRRYLGPLTLDAEARWRRGTGAFNALRAPEEDVDEGTSRPEILKADVRAMLPFTLGGENFRFSTEWREQWAFDKLVSRDRFSIGGRSTVRGYTGDMTLSADNGFVSRNELALDLGGTGQELYAALDFGRVWGPFDEYLSGNSLSGAALGYRGFFKGLSYDAFIAGPLHRPDYFPGDSIVTGFNVAWSF